MYETIKTVKTRLKSAICEKGHLQTSILESSENYENLLL